MIQNSFVQKHGDEKPVLICFSHLRWRFVYQRPQHLMTRAARQWTVYFFEEPIYERGASKVRYEVSQGAPGVTVVVPVLPEGATSQQAVDAQKAALDDVLAAHRGSVTAFWYYTPCAVNFSLHREPDLCVYDCMDELSAFKGASPELAACERRLFGLADLVFTGGRALYEAKRFRHPNVHLFPSSVDKDHFLQARRAGFADPADQANIKRPRIGFFGVLDERFDIELTAALADLRPDWQFILIGPVVKIEESALPRRANIHWLGCKDYQELPQYLAHWDAGFMPFAINAATRYISPTKTPEFLAAGLPVVSTPVLDVVRGWGEAGLVSISRDAENFAANLEGVMSAPREAWLAAVDRRLAKLSWNDTWRRMATLMNHEVSWRLRWQEISPRLEDGAPTSAEADNV
jgi:glycosyltransferase involved in cell wall biosynthesis